MYPELFSLGNLTVHSYGLMIALAILVSALLLYREAPREKINPDYILEAVIIAGIGGLLGARVLYMLLNWSYYSNQPLSAFFTQFEGLSFYGGFFLATVLIYLWSRWRDIGFLKLTDFMAPYLALGYAFGRMGCFLNGCCYGIESDVFWALPISPGDEVLRHPVQLYALVGALLIFFILKKTRPVRPFVGFLTVALFGLYGLLRFSTEFFRHGEAVWIGLTNAQVFSLALVITALLVMAAGFHFLAGDKIAKTKAKPKKTLGLKSK
ncbi:MAG: prolipoprotein diacylglyceryl transferase [Bacillota bacterium]